MTRINIKEEKTMKGRPIQCNYNTGASQFVRSTFAVVALLFWLGSYAWAETVLHEDFEDDPLGPLGVAWTVTSAGGGSVSIVNATAHGHVLRLQGSKAESEFLIATRAISSSSTDITAEVDIRPNSGASFIWTLSGAGTSIGRRRIRLQQAPGSTTLVAQTVPSGTTSCGTLPAGVWSRVTLTVDTVSRTFDVLINGTPTACTGVSAGIQPPFRGVSVMDASNVGWGGTVGFDNIDITTP
jgi:hypothetical protein